MQEVRGLDGLKEATVNIKPSETSPFKKYDPEGKVRLGAALLVAAGGMCNRKGCAM